MHHLLLGHTDKDKMTALDFLHFDCLKMSNKSDWAGNKGNVVLELQERWDSLVASLRLAIFWYMCNGGNKCCS